MRNFARIIGIAGIGITLALTANPAWAGRVNKESHALAAKKAKRVPASQPKFICEEPEIEGGAPAPNIARILNEKCDHTKTYTVTMTNPGSTYPVTVCCVAK